MQPLLRLLAVEKTMLVCISWYYFLLSLVEQLHWIAEAA